MPKDSLALTIQLFNKKISKLEEMLNSHIQGMGEAMKEMREEVNEKIQETKKDLPNLDNVLKSVKGKDGEDGKDSKVPGPKGDKGDKGDPAKNGKDGRNGIDGLDGLDGKDGDNGINGKDGKDGSPDTPEQVRDKLEILKGEERLDRSAIKGLEEEIEKLKKGDGGVRFFGGTRRLQPVRFSFTGDGSTTAFTLATNPYDELLIWAHAQGQWLQPTVHFTVAGRTLTTTYTPSNGEIIEGVFLKF